VIFDKYLAFASISAGPLRVVNILTVEYMFIAYSTNVSSVSRNQHMPPPHASVSLVYDRKQQRYAVDNRTEFNCTHE